MTTIELSSMAWQPTGFYVMDVYVSDRGGKWEVEGTINKTLSNQYTCIHFVVEQ